MFRALLNIFFVLNLLAQAQGDSLREDGSASLEQNCPSGTCRNLNQAKKEAIAKLNETLNQIVGQLIEISTEIENIGKDATKKNFAQEVHRQAELDKTKISAKEAELLIYAIKNGKDVSVLKCLSECESAASTKLMRSERKYVSGIKEQERNFLKAVVAGKEKLKNLEDNLKDVNERYSKAIETCIFQIGVVWHQNEALKQFSNILQNANGVTTPVKDAAGKYLSEASTELEKCKSELKDIREEGFACMGKCLETM